MKLDSFLETVLSKWRYRKAKNFIRDKKIILEIGCGAKASFLRNLAKFNDKKLIGIDPRIDESIPLSANFILIKKRVIDRIDLTDNSIERVIMLAVLEHLDKPQEIVNEIYRLLKIILIGKNWKIWRGRPVSPKQNTIISNWAAIIFLSPINNEQIH
jgi:2-polyprenyl-3-methyl-5-hydroxy-6-metoxy-1,4-benzoquinol methylase